MQENEAVCCVYYCSCTSGLDPRGHPRKLGGSPMKIKLKHELSREVPILVGFSYLSAFLPLWFNNSSSFDTRPVIPVTTLMNNPYKTLCSIEFLINLARAVA